MSIETSSSVGSIISSVTSIGTFSPSFEISSFSNSSIDNFSPVNMGVGSFDLTGNIPFNRFDGGASKEIMTLPNSMREPEISSIKPEIFRPGQEDAFDILNQAESIASIAWNKYDRNEFADPFSRVINEAESIAKITWDELDMAPEEEISDLVDPGEGVMLDIWQDYEDSIFEVAVDLINENKVTNEQDLVVSGQETVIESQTKLQPFIGEASNQENIIISDLKLDILESEVKVESEQNQVQDLEGQALTETTVLSPRKPRLLSRGLDETDVSPWREETPTVRSWVDSPKVYQEEVIQAQKTIDAFLQSGMNIAKIVEFLTPILKEKSLAIEFKPKTDAEGGGVIVTSLTTEEEEPIEEFRIIPKLVSQEFIIDQAVLARRRKEGYRAADKALKEHGSEGIGIKGWHIAEAMSGYRSDLGSQINPENDPTYERAVKAIAKSETIYSYDQGKKVVDKETMDHTPVAVGKGVIVGTEKVRSVLKGRERIYTGRSLIQVIDRKIDSGVYKISGVKPF